MASTIAERLPVDPGDMMRFHTYIRGRVRVRIWVRENIKVGRAQR